MFSHGELQRLQQQGDEQNHLLKDAVTNLAAFCRVCCCLMINDDQSENVASPDCHCFSPNQNSLRSIQKDFKIPTLCAPSHTGWLLPLLKQLTRYWSELIRQARYVTT